MKYLLSLFVLALSAACSCSTIPTKPTATSCEVAQVELEAIHKSIQNESGYEISQQTLFCEEVEPNIVYTLVAVDDPQVGASRHILVFVVHQGAAQLVSVIPFYADMKEQSPQPKPPGSYDL